jgi:lipopolysaccharide transport system permease protein
VETLPTVAVSEADASDIGKEQADPSAPSAAQGTGTTGYEIVIKSGQSERLYWGDLWRYRELLFVLGYRNISVQYKQTVIGIAWALIRPLSAVLIFVLVFSKIAGLDSEGVPYPLLVLAGMLPWQMFSSALSESSNSLVSNSNLISKVYFPRLIVPLSSLVVSLVDFLICLPVLVILMAVYQVVPTWRLVFFPVFMALGLACACSLGLWLCALNVRFRDVRYVIPFLLQLGVYLSPVPYSSSIVRAKGYYDLFALNPMVGVIDGMRWSLFGTTPPFESISFPISLAVMVVVLLGGVRYFRRTERTFADVI